MKFAFISTQDSAPWGGSELLWTETALRLRGTGHAVEASVPHFPELSPKILALRAAGIGLHVRTPRELGLAGRLRRKFTYARRWEWLRRFRPDLVVISCGGIWDEPECAEFCRAQGLPYAIILQANAETWWPDDIFSKRLRETYPSARKVFCVSRHNLRLTEKQMGFSLPTAEVVWNPTNLSQGSPPAWPDETKGHRLACVARLEPWAKGQDVLFEVLREPKWRERPVELNLYGGGRGEKSLRDLAQFYGLDKVHFRGHVSSIETIWAENHLLVLPSRVEGLPLTLVEAMQCGRPALVTDVGGNAELCIDGKTGFVAVAPVPSILDETLERAWQKRGIWEEMGRAGLTLIKELVPEDPIGEFQQKLLRLCRP